MAGGRLIKEGQGSSIGRLELEKTCYKEAVMENKVYRFDAVILRNGDKDAAYVEVPIDIKEVFGKGRLLVHATFDGVPYDGQVVKMGTPCHIIGVRKDIRKKINKTFGDTIAVTIQER